MTPVFSPLHLVLVICLAASPFTAFPSAKAASLAERSVALELLLAVDVSTSVNSVEFDLQMTGLALAFRHPALVAAIETAGPAGIAVSLVQWSDRQSQVMAVDWTPIAGTADAFALAERIQATPRLISGGGTSLRAAIDFAAGQFAGNGLAGARRVIDVSGDGGMLPFTAGSPRAARDRAVAQGFTINGLAVLDMEAWLPDFFAENVIGGPGAFVVTAEGYGDFARAMLIKLIREVGEPRLSEAPSPPPQAAQAGGQGSLTELSEGTK